MHAVVRSSGHTALYCCPYFILCSLLFGCQLVTLPWLSWARSLCRGYRGRIVSATDTHVRMELEAAYKTVTVKLGDLRGMGDQQGNDS